MRLLSRTAERVNGFLRTVLGDLPTLHLAPCTRTLRIQAVSPLFCVSLLADDARVVGPGASVTRRFPCSQVWIPLRLHYLVSIVLDGSWKHRLCVSPYEPLGFFQTPPFISVHDVTLKTKILESGRHTQPRIRS